MATVYSLICWGGLTGKSVTGATATDIITSTAHGLRTGTALVAQSTVSGVTSGTTYYASYIAANTFYLYDTLANAQAAGVTGRIDITATTAFALKSKIMLDYMTAYPTRWGASGSEKIYNGIAAWVTARSAASPLDSEICEIGEALDETNAINLAISCPAARLLITSMVDGARSSAFHAGVVGAGYAVRGTYAYGNIVLNSVYAEIDGFSVYDMVVGYRYQSAVSLAAALTKASNMIVVSNSSPSDNIGIYFSGGYTEARYCLVIGFGKGFFQYQYTSANTITNCIATKNTTGVYPAYSYDARGLTCVNTLSYGNVTTNWGACSGGITYAANNLGGTGQAYVTGANVRLETTDASPYSNVFTDWTNNVLSPAASTSPQVENGVEYYGISASDIVGALTPSYSGSAYNTTVTAGSVVAGLSYTIVSVGTTDFTAIGASASTIGITFKATGVGTGTGTATLNAKYDIGCYEKDLGYGSWPATATISLTDIVSGTRVRITKTSDGSVLYNDVPGTSLSFSTSHIGGFDVLLRKASASPYYREFNASGTTVADQTTTLKCLQQLDE